MAITIPAKRVDKIPLYNFAVYSLRDGSDTIELESSFVSQGQGEGMFDRQYSKWGLTDTSFYLVDWDKQQVIREHKA